MASARRTRSGAGALALDCRGAVTGVRAAMNPDKLDLVGRQLAQA
ncbi:hypothetical protein PV416_35130 [Streptomyces ipomoeae]|jgi:hypothetical protein|nr:hypothetical protein [Streptomyces ipomoeae]MDX2698808.1 hypothetical protein [Streptomyces ipomoeae]MDX2826161.1 hypothetical protein [Streptomyces ipomoeae]MDX2844519.1 hypothetical protein [Streptomyces ipomoeae]MDX2876806.1 hypothetical protein [Streptomyces ipomoeae]